MKEAINYYYRFDIEKILDYKNYSKFKYNNDIFYFAFYNRGLDELDDIVNVSIELKNKGIKTHDIIRNKDGMVLTKVGNNNYIMLKLNEREDESVSFDKVCSMTRRLILNNKTGRIYRNNWDDLWSKKIDYFEYQIKEIGKDKISILDSFSYFVGLAENAISYVNKVKRSVPFEGTNISLSHRRIFFPNLSLNYFNPLSFIFDLEVRDIAEYLKIVFFNKGDAILDLETYLKTYKLSQYSYNMLYARLLYPSYYFDIYEDIMNNNRSEDDIISVISKTLDYEDFLKKAYSLISKYAYLEPISWLNKKSN